MQRHAAYPHQWHIGCTAQLWPPLGPISFQLSSSLVELLHEALQETTTCNSSGHATKRGLRVPNPNSRGHATKRGLRVPNPNSRGHATKRGKEKQERKKQRNVFAPEKNWRCTRAGVLLRMQDLHFATNDICIAARLANLRWKAPRNKQHLYSTSCCDIWRSKALIKVATSKSKLATSPLPSWGPASGRKCYLTPTFSGVSSKGDKILGRLRCDPMYGL